MDDEIRGAYRAMLSVLTPAVVAECKRIANDVKRKRAARAAARGF